MRAGPGLLLLLLLSSRAWAAPALPKDYLSVPIVPQATGYSCGAAVLLALLYYWLDYDGNESGLYAELETDPKEGTRPERIAEAARGHGLKAEMREGLTIPDIRAALKRRETVILDIEAWRSKTAPPLAWSEDWEDGHYVILVGMDAKYAYVMDPSAYTGYGWLPLDELLERWHDEDIIDGKPRRSSRLGIFIRGNKPPKYAPGRLIRVQ
ncbi:MAG: C39 family peptidase [Elusimicrobia bacterium]|nr:C39 family peptidase [Elusimicrobiota bacterium]